MASTRCAFFTRLPPQRLSCSVTRTNKRIHRLRSLSDLEVDWSLFDKNPLGTLHEDGARVGMKEVASVVEAEEWNEEQWYYHVNKELVAAAAEALKTIGTYGPEHPLARQAAGKMIETYVDLTQTSSLNVVNWVTLLHRLGKLFEAMNEASFLFCSCGPLLGHATAAIGATHRQLNQRQIANIFWSLSRIGRRTLVVHHGQMTAPQLYSLLFERLLQFESMGTFEIGSIIGSLAKMDFKPGTCKYVMDHLTGIASGQMDEFMPCNVSNAIRGLGRMQYLPDNTFLKDAAERTLETLDSFNTMEMTNTLWGFASLKTRSSVRYLLPSMEQYFVREMWNFPSHGVPLILWSFVKLHYLPQQATLDRAVHVLRQRMHTLSAKSISQIAYAFAVFGVCLPADFVQQLTIAFFSKGDSARVQLMCLFGWCLAMLFSLDLDVFQRVIKSVEAADWRRELMEAEKRQLYQCMIHVQFFVPGGDAAVQKISSELIHECRRMWEEGQDTKFTDTVSLSALPLLQRMGYAVESRQLVSKGLARHFVDVVQRADDPSLIAVQVTIPAHQFRNEKMMIKGPRQWMTKLLKKEGYKVLLLDGRTWRDLESTEERIEYLGSLLEEIRF